MKKITLFLAAVFLLCSVNAFAAEKMKFGTIDLQRALNESEAGIKAKEELKAEYDKHEKDLNARQEELKKLKEELEAKAKVWNSDTKEKKEKELREKWDAFQTQLNKLNEDLNKKKVDREREILNTIKGILEDIAKKDSYTFIFEVSSGAVLYKPDDADITDKVITELNKKKK